MSNVKLLILPSVIQERMSLHTNVDEKLIFPEIKAAQDMYIRPLLGSILFDKLLNDIATNTLSGQYLILMNDFIIDSLCNYVMSELPEGLNYQYFNKGVSTKTADQSQSPSMSDMYAIVSKYKKRAEHYAQRCRLYLVQNYTLIPEYYAPGGIDRVIPDRASFSSPIYLGNRGGQDDFFNKPTENYNEPYYPFNSDI
jgi:hypothetical protein